MQMSASAIFLITNPPSEIFIASDSVPVFARRAISASAAFADAVGNRRSRCCRACIVGKEKGWLAEFPLNLHRLSMFLNVLGQQSAAARTFRWLRSCLLLNYSKKSDPQLYRSSCELAIRVQHFWCIIWSPGRDAIYYCRRRCGSRMKNRARWILWINISSDLEEICFHSVFKRRGNGCYWSFFRMN